MDNKAEKILYLDCFSGISGDMMAGALLDAGVGIEYLKKELAKLGLEGYSIKKSRVMSGPISAVKFDVKTNGRQKPRDYGQIKKIIKSSSLKNNVKKTSFDIFDSIAAAEAKIHGKDMARVHFHEVGAIDSIIDIAAAAIGLDALGADRVLSAPMPLGKGQAETAHGKIPIPAPATLEILKGVPTYQGDFDFEVTTPTGAGIVKAAASGFEKMPPLEIEAIGYGAGSRKIQGGGKAMPNVLRIIIGRSVKGTGSGIPFYSGDTVMLTANIDDSSPEVLGYAIEKLNGHEAVKDAWIENIYMKKNRPAFKLNVICDIKRESAVARMIFEETSTIGIRREEISRYCLDRKVETIKLPYGEVQLKTAIMDGKAVNDAPEYESCRELARKTGKPLKDVYLDICRFLSKR